MKLVLVRLAVVSCLLMAAAGCHHSNSGDPVATPVGTFDTNRFWIFPNPGEDPATGVYTTNDASYGQAYYAAIDPGNARATLAGFQGVNGFGTSVTGVTEAQVIFRDVRDLGYGRRMTVRFTGPGYPGWPGTHWVAVYVGNYQVVPFAGDDYTGLNLEAAIAPDPAWHVGTNAIEYSVVAGVPFTKFYTYSPSGTRLNTVNLDGRGQKAMPSVCINCHGGRADPLSATGIFPNGGNVRARLQPINVGTLEFASSGSYTRAAQEEALRQINYAIFCAHSNPAGAVPAGIDTCRPVPSSTTGGHDYQGAEAEMMKSWYSAGALDTPGTALSDTYIPDGWKAVNTLVAGTDALYTNVVAPYCRVCHALRGTENTPQDDIDFLTYAKFLSHADRIKAHVFDRGNMPLGLILYNAFWKSTAPQQLADWLTSVNVAYNPTRVSGGPTGQPAQPHGTLTDPAFLSTGTHSTSNYIGSPGNTTFATIKSIIQNVNTVSCTSCHSDLSVGSVGSPPIAYTNYDRDGSGGPADANDDIEFYKALRGRVNLTDFLASPLLRKPTGHHHAGGYILDPTLTATPTYTCQSGIYPDCLPFATLGDYNQAVYNTFLDWIGHGAPYSYNGSTPVFNPP